MKLVLFIACALQGVTYLFLTSPSLALESIKSVSVSASIPQNSVTIYGYTSPLSRVELTNSTVFAATYSRVDGYFEFDHTFLPKNSLDLCLTSFDDSLRTSIPTCIPAPPPTNYHTNIGPIILPPTLTLDQPEIKPQATAYASGQSIPNSTVEIHLYQVSNHAPVFPKTVRAFSLPSFSTKSDSQGNYNLTLPTAISSNYRLFATVNYHDDTSPKSNTLTYLLPSLFYLFWLQNSWLLITLPIFVLTLTLLFYLIYLNYISKKHYLPAIFHFPPAIIYKRSL